MAKRVYIPEPGAYVQTAANEQFPGGNVRHLNPGWVELDEELEKNSVLARLVPEDDAEQQRRFSVYEAQTKRDEAISQAGVEFYQHSIDVENESNEEMRKEEEERAKRVEEDMKKGITRSEPHPDPLAQWSIALTASPSQHMMVSAAGMAGKADPFYGARPDNTLPGGGPGGGAGSGTRPDNTLPGSGSSKPVNRDVPHVTGDGTVGTALNCTMGNWEGEPTSYEYKWKADGSTDLGSGQNYTPQQADVGKAVTCVVSATNAAGTTEAPPSNAVTVKENGGAARNAGGRATL